MPKCELEIALEQPDRVYRPGEKILGVVLVKVDRECHCDRLTLRSHWWTNGPGNREWGKGTLVEVHRGLWVAGQEEAYPFEIEAPSFPFTYHGHQFSLVWYLQARAHVPWKSDPKTEHEFLVWPREQGKPEEPEKGTAERVGGLLRNLGLNTFYDILYFVGFSFMVGCVWIQVALLEEGSDGALLPVGVILFLQLYLGFKLIRNCLARGKLGKVEFSFVPAVLRVGGSFHARVRFNPRKPLRLNGILLRLLGQEIAVLTSGGHTTTYDYTLHDETYQLLPGDELLLPGRVEFEKTVDVPCRGPSEHLWGLQSGPVVCRGPDRYPRLARLCRDP